MGLRIFRFVVDHAIIANNVCTQKLYKLVVRVGAMGPQLVEEDDLLPLHPVIVKISEKDGDDAFVGRGASEVGKRYANTATGLEPVAESRTADRRRKTIKNGPCLVSNSGLMAGSNDFSIVRKVYLK
jgi:hypothetical protein